jgi:hypothetical protein
MEQQLEPLVVDPARGVDHQAGSLDILRHSGKTLT